MAEIDIQNRARLELSKHGVTTFRNNVGFGWCGKVKKQYGDGTILLAHGNPVRFGLMEGSTDLIGFKSVVVTPDMVGKKLAVFVALETKTLTGPVREKQRSFIKSVKEAGGMAGVYRSEQESLLLITL